MNKFPSELENLWQKLESQSHEFWNIGRTSAELLFLLVKSIKARRILEIGTSNGYSGLWFARALYEVQKEGGDMSQALLITVESHSGRFALAAEHFEGSGLKDFIFQVQGHAPEILAQIPEIQAETFDLIFIDATKMEYLNYFQAVSALLKSGGLLIADNVRSHRQAMANFLGFVEQDSQWDSVTLPVDAGLLILRKKYFTN